MKRNARLLVAASPLVASAVSYFATSGSAWFFAFDLVPGAMLAAPWLMRERTPPPPAASPPARSPRYPDGAPEGTCPVCGMDDAERFRLAIGVTQYRGQAAHSTCVEWIGGDPVPAPAGTNFAPCRRGSCGGNFTFGVPAGRSRYGITMAEFEANITAAFGIPPPAMGTATTLRPGDPARSPAPRDGADYNNL